MRTHITTKRLHGLHPRRRSIARPWRSAWAIAAGILVHGPAAVGQIETHEAPRSFRQIVEPSVITRDMPAVTRAQIDDARRNVTKAAAFTFGVEHTAPIDLKAAAVFDESEDGDRIYRLRVRSAGAAAIGLVFQEFELDAGAELYVYDDARSHVRGAFTAANNKDHRGFQIHPVAGDAVTLELFEPGGSRSTVMLGQVVHDFSGLFGDGANGAGLKSGSGSPKAGSCEVDVLCPEGLGWEDERRAVTLIINGGSLCSGALINNTANDGTQYFWSANHCGDMSNAVFRFNYERPGCSSGSAPTSQTVHGAVGLATSTSVDYRLIRITETIPKSYGAFFAGWSRSTSAPTSTTAIHHPTGSPKKISFDFQPPVISGNNWRIKEWDVGVTEPGSSGSPLLDPNGRIIGQLCCGEATCAYPKNDYYGRFDLAWNAVKSWLDPIGAAPTLLDGYDPAAGCGAAVPFGVGCAGSWGFTPELSATGCLKAGGAGTLVLSKGLGGSQAVLLLGMGQANVPIGGSCALLISPILPLVVGPLPLGGVLPGTGGFSLPFSIPPSATAGQLGVQGFVVDNAQPIGFTGTNGLWLTIP